MLFVRLRFLGGPKVSRGVNAEGRGGQRPPTAIPARSIPRPEPTDRWAGSVSWVASIAPQLFGNRLQLIERDIAAHHLVLVNKCRRPADLQRLRQLGGLG